MKNFSLYSLIPENETIRHFLRPCVVVYFPSFGNDSSLSESPLGLLARTTWSFESVRVKSVVLIKTSMLNKINNMLVLVAHIFLGESDRD